VAWNDKLEGPALEIAEVDGKPLRVQAGPGTGKTFALQRRVMRALEAGVPGGSILVVTFTRVAASDLRENLQQMDVPGCENVDARTLHSFCFSTLTREDVFPSLRRNPRPLIGVYKLGWIQYEYDPLLADLDDPRYGDKRERTRRLRAFEAAWARAQRDEVTPATDPVDHDFERDLVAWLTFHRAITIGELVPITLQHFRQNPLDPALTRYSYVIVDEYQDLNKAEQVLVDKIAEKAQLTVVGDADQSIYSFKHANPEGMSDFSARHPDVVDKSLLECRRCPTDVVDAANALIAKNPHPVAPPALNHFPGNPQGTIFHVQWASVSDEVRGITSYIERILGSKDAAGASLYEPKDVLVLCPSRDIAYMLRDEMVGRNIPAHSFYHEEALEDDEAKIAFCTLNLFLDPDDRVCLRYWLGFGSSNWRSPQYKKLRALCEVEGKSPKQVLDEVHDTNRTIAGISSLTKRYTELRKKILDLYAVDSDGALAILFPEGVVWARPFRDLIDALKESHERATIADIFEGLRDYITQPDVPADPDYVRIMSLYKSKGLTSKVVIVTSCVDGTIPRYEDKLPPEEAAQKLEEQRRLFYVALTRPKAVLVLSHYRQIQGNILYRVGAILRNKHAYPSLFIVDAGARIPEAKAGPEWLESIS
jgi:DNA helicase-2/ATP-dependent DNA helicase PcrA